MATKQITLRMEFSFEIDEERLRDICEEQDIKFTKKMIKEAIDDFENSFDQDELNDTFEEAFVTFLAENYGE